MNKIRAYQFADLCRQVPRDVDVRRIAFTITQATLRTDTAQIYTVIYALPITARNEYRKVS